MARSNRRTFLKVLGAGGAAALGSWPLFRALADGPTPSTEFFIFVHAAGGWDVMLSLDPRNQTRGIVNPPSTANMDAGGIRLWTAAPPDASGATSFQIVQPSGCNIPFGPAMGKLVENRHYDRMTVFNGLTMNTVSHPDGVTYSATGRHLAGGSPVQPSIDAVFGNAFGLDQSLPVVSFQPFPSAFVGLGILDRRAVPLQVEGTGSIARLLTRTDHFLWDGDRAAITDVLVRECDELASRSYYPEVPRGLGKQYAALRNVLTNPTVLDAFSDSALANRYPQFNGLGYAGQASFAVEAFRQGLARCVCIAFAGYGSLPAFDTHRENYRLHAASQQDMFDTLAVLLETLDATAHPTLTGQTLGDHTHILVLSDFCRTPQINVSGGRDHYPNNSMLVFSPKFRGNKVFGRSDPEQVLPAPDPGVFPDRPVAPPDVLATFMSAFGIDPAPLDRDGVVITAALAP